MSTLLSLPPWPPPRPLFEYRCLHEQGVRSSLGRARQRSRHSDGSAMAWSWLTLSPRPVRVTVAAADPRFGVYLTVLPAGNGNPPSHRPMYGCHMLSRVLAGEVQQVRTGEGRGGGRGVCGAGVCCLHDKLTDMLLLLLLLLLLVVAVVVVSLLLLSN